jgi:protein gp37
MGKTSIEWTDASWNPIVGCTEVSPGCANCYAARLSASRLAHVPAYKGLATIETNGSLRGQRHVRWIGEVRFLPERLEEPRRWKKPRRIFVCDMGDLFHAGVTIEQLIKVWGVMASNPRHTFQILTKRAGRMHAMVTHVMNEITKRTLGPLNAPLQNVWLGVSVENQHFADERIPHLLQTPAAVRFLSCEPLLGPLNLRDVQGKDFLQEFTTPSGITVPRAIDWIIAGGESGPHARPMHPNWPRSLRDQCQAAGVPFFFKQWGEYSPWDQSRKLSPKTALKGFCGTAPKFEEQWMTRVGKKAAGRLLDGREWNEFPLSAP